MEFSAAALVGVDGAPARYRAADQTGIVNGLTDKTEQAIGTELPGAIRPRRPTSIPVIEQECCDKYRNPSAIRGQISAAVDDPPPSDHPVRESSTSDTPGRCASTDWCSSTNPILGCGASCADSRRVCGYLPWRHWVGEDRPERGAIAQSSGRSD